MTAAENRDAAIRLLVWIQTNGFARDTDNPKLLGALERTGLVEPIGGRRWVTTPKARAFLDTFHGLTIHCFEEHMS